MTAATDAPSLRPASEFAQFIAQLELEVGPALSTPVYQGSVLTQCFANARLELATNAQFGTFGRVRISDLGIMLQAAAALPPEVGPASAGAPQSRGQTGVPGDRVDRSLAQFFAAHGGFARFGPPLAAGFDHAGRRCQLFSKAVLRRSADGEVAADPLGSRFLALDRLQRGLVDPLPLPGDPTDPQSGIDAPIIYYHEVPDPEAFARQLAGLQADGYNMIPYERLVRALQGTADLPERPLVLTFDDGRTSQLQNAAPVLVQMRLPATFFVLPGFDRLEPGHIDQNAFVRLRNWGFSVQSHTLNHADLTTLLPSDRGAAEAEVVHSRDALLPIGGGDHFSYPFGAYDQAAADLVRAAGYASAVSTRYGRVHFPDDLYRLARIQINPQAGPALVRADLGTPIP